MTGYGYLKQVSPKSARIVHFQYDPEQCELSGGVGGWSEVPRPRMVAGTEFTGTPLLKLSFDLWLDGFADGTSIEAAIAQYYAWGMTPAGNAEPPVLQLGYATYSRLRWVMQDVSVTSTLRRLDGQRVQAKVSISLLEYQGLTARSTAADSVRAGIVAVAVGSAHKNPQVSVYTVVKGDTLQKISARHLGTANRWKEIANLNKLRDPQHLKVGAKLKLPAK